MLRLSLALLFALSFLPAGEVRSAPTPAFRAGATSQGVTLTLTVPRVVYPQHALIGGTIRVKNVSQHTIYIVGQCALENPRLEVLDASGQVVYPPVSSTIYPIIFCPPMPANEIVGLAVRPGKTYTRQIYAIGRGPSLRAFATVAWLDSAGEEVGGDVVTPPLSVRFTASTQPLVQLHTSRGSPYIVVHPIPKAHGRLFYQFSARCQNPIPEEATNIAVPTSLTWQSVRGSRIGAPCDQYYTSEWHVVAGWVGHPVATLDYVRPALAPLQPHSPKVAVGKAYAFKLSTRCGVDFDVDFDGSFWDLADARWVAIDGKLPPGIGHPYQRGTMTLLGADEARFTFSRGHILFRRHVGPKYILSPCS